MKRYIDLNEFAKIIKKYVKAEPDAPEDRELIEWCTDECIRLAYAMPTDDVQEIKHGYWTIRYEGTYKRAKCYCSVCGKSNGIGGTISNQKKPYCPNCGAKLDLEED